MFKPWPTQIYLLPTRVRVRIWVSWSICALSPWYWRFQFKLIYLLFIRRWSPRATSTTKLGCSLHMQCHLRCPLRRATATRPARASLWPASTTSAASADGGKVEIKRDATSLLTRRGGSQRRGMLLELATASFTGFVSLKFGSMGTSREWLQLRSCLWFTFSSLTFLLSLFLPRSQLSLALAELRVWVNYFSASRQGSVESCRCIIEWKYYTLVRVDLRQPSWGNVNARDRLKRGWGPDIGPFWEWVMLRSVHTVCGWLHQLSVSSRLP